MPPEWMTTENLNAMAQWYLDGHSASQIATKLGVNKNHIVGKLHRLKLKRGDAVPVITEVRPTPNISDFHDGAMPVWRSSDADELFARCWLGGVPRSKLMAFFQVNLAALRRVRDRLGLSPRLIINPRVGDWRTPESDAEFTRRWDAGEPAREMMTHFGVCRATLTERRIQLGLKPRTGNEAVEGEVVPRAPRVRPVSPAKETPKQSRVVAPVGYRFAVDLRRSTPAPRLPSISRLGDGRIGPCQYPTAQGSVARPDDWLFCGDPSVPGRSYCPQHCRACYVGWVAPVGVRVPARAPQAEPAHAI